MSNISIDVIPTNLKSDKGSSTNTVIVTKTVTDNIYGGDANFNNITSDTANINTIKSNSIDATTINSNIIKSSIINADKGDFNVLNADNAEIVRENVQLSNIANLYANFAGLQSVKSDNLVSTQGTIENLISKEITTTNLNVTGSAHFYELIIDQIKAVGGSIILSPADGFEYYGYDLSDSIRLRIWWICEEGKNGKYNLWKFGDFALCQNFNNANVGQSAQSVATKFCWARVIGVEDEAKYMVKADANHPNKLTNVTANINNISPTYRRSDFVQLENGTSVWRTRTATDYIYTFISNEEYEELTPEQQALYTLDSTAYYTIDKNNGTDVIYITANQWSGSTRWGQYYLRNYVKGEVKRCFSITLSRAQGDYANNSMFVDSDSEPIFEEGDYFVMLGHRKHDGESSSQAVARQSAIYISSYDSIDNGYVDLNNDINIPPLKAPLIAQYKGINDFSLGKHRWSYFDANTAYFKGDFVTTDGLDISDTISHMNLNYYKLIPNYSILTRNGATDVEQHTIDINILSNINSTTIYNTQVPSNTKLDIIHYTTAGGEISSTSILSGSTADIRIPYDNSNYGYSKFTLMITDSTPKVGDEIIVNVANTSGNVGPQGDPGISYQVMPEYELVTIDIQDPTSTSSFETLDSHLYVKLGYKLVKIEGDNITQEPWANLISGTTDRFETDYNIVININNDPSFALFPFDRWGYLENGWYFENYPHTDVPNPYVIYYENENFLDVCNEGIVSNLVDYSNYQSILENYNEYDDENDIYVYTKCPTVLQFSVQKHAWSFPLTRQINVEYSPHSVFVNNDSVLYSAKVSSQTIAAQAAAQGVQDAQNWVVQQNYSTIQQTAQGIQAAVGQLNTYVQGTYSTKNELTLTANNFNTTITGVQNTLQDEIDGVQGAVQGVQNNLTTYYYNKSQIDQRLDGITLSVSNVQGAVQGVQDNLANNYYTKSETYTKGEVVVQATQVALGVQSNITGELRNTGINIEDGIITLDAQNTNITGSLNIMDTSSGIVLYSDNEPKISITNDNVGGISNTKLHYNIQKVNDVNSSGVSEQTFVITPDLEFKAGGVYSMQNIYLYSLASYGQYTRTPIGLDQAGVKIEIYSNTNTLLATLIDRYSSEQNYFKNLNGVTSFQVKTLIGESTFDWNNTNYNGEGYIKFSIVYKYSSTYNDMRTANAIADFNWVAPISNATKIGNDGALFIHNANKYIQLTSSAYKLYNGSNNNGIEIKHTSDVGDYIERVIGSAKGDIGALCNVRRIQNNASNTVTPKDGFIIYSSWTTSTHIPYITLPIPSTTCTGRKIMIKNMTRRWIRIGTTDSLASDGSIISGHEHIIGSTSSTAVANRDVEDDSLMYVCDGEYWYEFWMG